MNSFTSAMAYALIFLLGMLIALNGCTLVRASGADGVSGTTWHHDGPDGCWQYHDNGKWAKELCRDGRGFLVWVDWLL